MAKHDDVAEDKKLIKSMVKPSAVKKGMKKGGPTGKDMRAVGRNLARAHNQKPGSK
jgi:hypothetical protein